MKVEIVSLVFLLGTVFATETVQINNQTFKLVPLGRGANKFGVKTEASRDFKLFSVPTESPKKESMDTPTSSQKVSSTEDSVDCEVRISVSSSGLIDIEQLIDQYNNQKMICKVSYVNGDKYEGEMTQNMRNGNGQMIYANGEIYNGMWVDGAENGTGKLASLFVFSLRLSLGIKVLLDSSVYNGQFLNNSRTGNEVLSHYHLFDDSSGFGTLVYQNGDVYDGTYANSIGFVVISADVGDFVDGVWEGEGSYYFHTGDVYTGQYHKGKRHGEGVYYFASGLEVYDGMTVYYCTCCVNLVLSGMWVNDTIEGRGLYLYPDNGIYEGEFHQGRREGKGTHKYPNGW